MARKSRRSTSSRKNSSLFAWPRVLIVVLPLLAAIVIFTNNQNARSVLGISDSNLLNLGKKETTSSDKPKPKPSCNRVTSFSASTICQSSTEEKSNNAFSTYTYTCEDGTSGSVEQREGKCVPISKAYELARKACRQKCKPSITPTKTPTPIPAEDTDE